MLLINPSYNFPVKREMYPSGALLLLGTMAEQRGHEVRLIHMVADGLDVPGVVEQVKEWQPDVVGITVSTFQVKVTRELTQEIKRAKEKTFIVIGGPHPSSIGVADAERYFAPHVDKVICGEGEFAFLEVLEGSNIERPANLDYVPTPDLSLVGLKAFSGAYPLGDTPAMFMMASRGCPGRCTFCNKAIFGNKVRYRPPDNILNELEYLAGRGIREVFFQDDTFNLNRGWCEEILRGIIRRGLNSAMRFRAPFRADKQLVDIDLLKLAKAAGFWLIFYGVESGNQGMLNRMHKGLTLEEIERAFRLTHGAGIKTEASFILGLPGETPETIGQTIAFYGKLRPFWAGFSLAIPFPGTVLYEEVKDNLLVKAYEDYRPGQVYFTPGAMDKQQLYRFYHQASQLIKRREVAALIQHPRMLYRTMKALL